MRIPRFIGPRRHREKGSITIEMALAMPVLLFMIAGVIDLSMLFWKKQVITNAAREGARIAAKAMDTGTKLVPLKTKSDVQNIVQDYLTKFSIKDLDGSDLALNSSNFIYQWIDTASGPVLTVKLNQIPYKMMLLPNIKTLFGGTRTSGDEAFYLSAQTSMAAEWPLTSPPSP
jgi:Flp pilus assembly protein TadG